MEPYRSTCKASNTVIHQNVETTICFPGKLDECLNFGFFADVRPKERGTAAGGFDQANGFAAACFVDIANHDRTFLAREAG
jgi:hypothetical protein